MEIKGLPLPPELTSEIINNLPQSDVTRFSMVNRTSYELSYSNSQWKRFVEEDFPLLYKIYLQSGKNYQYILLYYKFSAMNHLYNLISDGIFNKSLYDGLFNNHIKYIIRARQNAIRYHGGYETVYFPDGLVITFYEDDEEYDITGCYTLDVDDYNIEQSYHYQSLKKKKELWMYSDNMLKRITDDIDSKEDLTSTIDSFPHRLDFEYINLIIEKINEYSAFECKRYLENISSYV